MASPSNRSPTTHRNHKANPNMGGKIGIIDYQMGNLRSVQKAFEKNGFEAEIFSDPCRFDEFQRIVLPGVGAFRDAIAELQKRSLCEPITHWIAQDRPFLGICLGLQLLFEKSFEEGQHEGLGILKGDVARFEIDPSLKVPHMGWNRVARSASFHQFDSIAQDSHFYFVHSYYVRPSDPAQVALTANYGIEFCAAVKSGNLFATQFHPEKSQTAGLKLLKQFAEGESPTLQSE